MSSTLVFLHKRRGRGTKQSQFPRPKCTQISFMYKEIFHRAFHIRLLRCESWRVPGQPSTGEGFISINSSFWQLFYSLFWGMLKDPKLNGLNVPATSKWKWFFQNQTL